MTGFVRMEPDSLGWAAVFLAKKIKIKKKWEGENCLL
jgi:hypothetical protein